MEAKKWLVTFPDQKPFSSYQTLFQAGKREDLVTRLRNGTPQLVLFRASTGTQSRSHSA